MIYARMGGSLTVHAAPSHDPATALCGVRLQPPLYPPIRELTHTCRKCVAAAEGIPPTRPGKTRQR